VPHLQEHVTVMGFPQGGDNLSITSGVVSRVELTNYVHGAAQLLAIQLDAAINPGNSGGPAVQNGKVVGLAFQNLANADNIGYVIPTPIVRRFLEDVAVIAEGNSAAATEPTRDGREEKNDAARNENAELPALETSGGASFETHHAGFCALGVKCQATDNPALRAYYGMAKNETGVLVTHVAPLSPSRSVLRKDDVLLEIDGRKIANDGTVSFRGWERVAFDHLVSLKRPDEAVALTVRRRRVVAETSEASETSRLHGSENAKLRSADERDERDERASSSVTDTVVETLTVRAKPRAPLVPAHQYDRLPSFFLYAGLVFSPLTQPHLHEFGDDWFNAAPRRLCDRALNDHPTVPGEQVVLLSQVLADEINAGYQGMHDVEVRAVNGERVENLKALKSAVEKATGAFLRLDLADDRVLVVNREEADKAHARIMAKHRVPGRMSRDLA
jgi:S1-C subfamily serine protease